MRDGSREAIGIIALLLFAIVVVWRALRALRLYLADEETPPVEVGVCPSCRRPIDDVDLEELKDGCMAELCDDCWFMTHDSTTCERCARLGSLDAERGRTE